MFFSIFFLYGANRIDILRNTWNLSFIEHIFGFYLHRNIAVYRLSHLINRFDVMIKLEFGFYFCLCVVIEVLIVAQLIFYLTKNHHSNHSQFVIYRRNVKESSCGLGFHRNFKLTFFWLTFGWDHAIIFNKTRSFIDLAQIRFNCWILTALVKNETNEFIIQILIYLWVRFACNWCGISSKSRIAI